MRRWFQCAPDWETPDRALRRRSHPRRPRGRGQGL